MRGFDRLEGMLVDHSSVVLCWFIPIDVAVVVGFMLYSSVFKHTYRFSHVEE
jgi:hypothetical protein